MLKVVWMLQILCGVCCRDCFPTRARLISTCMHCPIDCVLCGSNFDDSIRVILECPSTMHIWREVNLLDKIDKALRQDYNMYALIFSLLSQLTLSQSAQFATILWSIWKRMNLMLWQQKTETNAQVLTRVTTLLEDWRSTRAIRRDGGATRVMNPREPN